MDAEWRSPLKGWSAEQRAGGKAESTIALWRSWLRRFAREHPDPWSVTRAEIVEWLAEHAWRPETRRSARCALRSFYGWAVDLGELQEDPTARLPRIRVPRREPRPAPAEVVGAALVSASFLVQLMLELAAECGLRRAEVARVRTTDLTRQVQDGVTVHVLHVYGKGGVERDVPVPRSLAVRILTQPTGWLFPSSSSASGHLTPGAVGKLTSRALPGRWTLHTLRHYAATTWAEEGLDLHEIARLLGHASVRTTQIYTAVRWRRLAAGVEAAAARLEQPPAA